MRGASIVAVSLLVVACSRPQTTGLLLDLGAELGGALVVEEDSNRIVGGDGQLELPVGTAVEYGIPGGGGARLQIESVVGRDTGPEARLALSVWAMPKELGEPIGRTTIQDLLNPGQGMVKTIEFPPSATGWRMRLEATGVDSAAGSIHLQGAKILAVRPPPEVAVGTSRRRSTPNVVLYVVDTLRQDHLGAYGYQAARTPSLDLFAEEATRFRRAEGHASWTRATVASLMTGLEPPVHATIDRGDGLPRDVPLLAEILAVAGFATKAVFTNSNAGPDAGFDRGFAHVDHLREEVTPEIHQPAGRATALAIDWLDNLGTRPFLLYLHVSDPHDPYLPPGSFRPELEVEGVPSWLGTGRSMRRLERRELTLAPEHLASLRTLYDGEIAAQDAAFGALADKLVATDRWKNTVVIVVADHGEEFLDHGRFTHAKTLHSEMLSIPLMIKFPGGEAAGVVVESIARQIDVLPTILELVGKPIPEGVQGRSLLSLARGARDFEPAFGYHDLAGSTLRSVRVHDVKLIGRALPDRSYQRIGLFDLASDPTEQVDVSGLHPEWVSFLELLWRRQRRERARAHRPTVISRHFEVQERLEALGYL